MVQNQGEEGEDRGRMWMRIPAIAEAYESHSYFLLYRRLTSGRAMTTH
jgi:hypothetical protein